VQKTLALTLAALALSALTTLLAALSRLLLLLTRLLLAAALLAGLATLTAALVLLSALLASLILLARLLFVRVHICSLDYLPVVTTSALKRSSFKPTAGRRQAHRRILSLLHGTASGPEAYWRQVKMHKQEHLQDANTPNSPPNPGAPAVGVNSFTEGQAKSRIEANGFADVSDLRKNGLRRAPYPPGEPNGCPSRGRGSL
jgi:hypothetical protein